MSQILIYKNKKSGKFFISLQDYRGGSTVFIRPDGIRKAALDLELFDDEEVCDIDHLPNLEKRGLITEAQRITAEQYAKNREEEAIENLKNYYDRLPDWEKQSFLETLKKEYIKDDL